MVTKYEGDFMMLLKDRTNENIDSMITDYRKDFTLYFHCSAIVVELAKGSRKKWIVRVAKSNTGEELYCESGNEIGMLFSREEAQKRCNEIANNPWKHLGAMLKNKSILEEEREKELVMREGKLAQMEAHIEEEIIRRAKELLENDKKANFGEKIMLRDTK